MKIINNDRAAIILSLVTATAKTQFAGKMHDVVSRVKKVTLKPGANNVKLSDEDTEILVGTAAVKAYIEEGTLRFPDVEELEGIYQTKQKAKRERLARISKAPSDDVEEAATSDNEELAALRSQVAAMQQVLEQAGLSGDDSGKKAAKSTKKKTTKKVGKKAKAAEASEASEGSDGEGGE